jgi:hypothetical protein
MTTIFNPVTRPLPTVSAVVDVILRGLTDRERWELMDQLTGRIKGWTIRQKRILPRRNEARDAEWTKLHDIDGLSYSDIAYKYGVPRCTVISAILRHRQSVYVESLHVACG